MTTVEIKLTNDQYQELISALVYAAEQRYYEASETTDQEDATAICDGAKAWEELSATIPAQASAVTPTLPISNTIIIRGGDFGEDINGVLTINNPDGKCGNVVQSAAERWNKMDVGHPGWLPYIEFIKDALKQAGYVFEDTQYEIIDDWNEI